MRIVSSIPIIVQWNLSYWEESSELIRKCLILSTSEILTLRLNSNAYRNPITDSFSIPSWISNTAHQEKFLWTMSVLIMCPRRIIIRIIIGRWSILKINWPWGEDINCQIAEFQSSFLRSSIELNLWMYVKNWKGIFQCCRFGT